MKKKFLSIFLFANLIGGGGIFTSATVLAMEEVRTESSDISNSNNTGNNLLNFAEKKELDSSLLLKVIPDQQLRKGIWAEAVYRKIVRADSDIDSMTVEEARQIWSLKAYDVADFSGLDTVFEGSDFISFDFLYSKIDNLLQVDKNLLSQSSFFSGRPISFGLGIEPNGEVIRPQGDSEISDSPYNVAENGAIEEDSSENVQKVFSAYEHIKSGGFNTSVYDAGVNFLTTKKLTRENYKEFTINIIDFMTSISEELGENHKPTFHNLNGKKMTFILNGIPLVYEVSAEQYGIRDSDKATLKLVEDVEYNQLVGGVTTVGTIPSYENLANVKLGGWLTEDFHYGGALRLLFEKPSTEETTDTNEEPSTEETTDTNEEPSTEETTDINEEPSTEETTDTNEEPSTEEITDTGDKTMWIEKETANSQDKNYSFETTKKEEASKENNKGRLPSTGEKAGTFLSVLGGLSLFGFVLVYVYRKLKIVK